MSAKFDWSKYEEVPQSSGTKGSFDWSKYEEAPKTKENFGHEGKILGGIVGGASHGVVKNQDTLYPAAGLAAIKTAELPGHLPGIAAKGLSKIFGEPDTSIEPTGDWRDKLPFPERTKIPSEYYRDFATEGMSDREKEEFEDTADLLSFFIPLKVGGGKVGNAISKEVHTPPPSYKKTPEAFESGLMKPRAVEAKSPGRGIITPNQRQNVLEKLDTEAAEITKKSLEKHVPIAKQIEEGFDFEGKFEREFRNLRALAKKHNPTIDITPLSTFMREFRERYRGIPKPHAEAAKILEEIREISKRPPTEMYNLLKTYRSNNQKIKNIFETSRLTGKQKEYVDFLSGMNKKIEQSFATTLPKDSAWMQQFREMNANYREYRNAQDTLKILEPILGEEVNTRSLRKLGLDPKRQAKLRLKMGEQGANEIIQLGKDLESAIKAIKDIRARDWTKWDLALPFSYLIPGLGKPIGALATLIKSVPYARRMYGSFLTKPKKIKIYDEALKSIINNDLPAYQNLAKKIIDPQAREELAKGASVREGKYPVKEKVFDVNPRYIKEKYLEEPEFRIRGHDRLPISKPKKEQLSLFRNEWNKYLTPETYEKYYDPDTMALGTLGDLIKDPKLRHQFREILDVPVEKSSTIPGWGRHHGYRTGSSTRSEILLKPNMSPQKVHSTLVHEGIHALQLLRKNKHGKSRLEIRQTKNKTFEDYLKNLNEVNARKFQNWVDLPVKKHRSELEKTRFAERLLNDQKNRQ